MGLRRILLTGSHGFIGSALVSYLNACGYQVLNLVRVPPQAELEVFWDPQRGILEPGEVEDFFAWVHLAGENIAKSRRLPDQKERIQSSRILGTKLLVDTIGKLQQPPQVLLCASATGYYGDRGDELLTEASPCGEGFLAKTCEAWEQMAQTARQYGVRVVNLRLGMVLGRHGGALAEVLPVFRWGFGGVLGHGRQYWAWVTLADVLRTMGYVLDHPALADPINVTTPHPVTNREFTKTLGRVLCRPTLMRVPAWAIKVVYGDIGEELLLASARATPGVLLRSGFQFEHPVLEEALRNLLDTAPENT